MDPHVRNVLSLFQLLLCTYDLSIAVVTGELGVDNMDSTKFYLGGRLLAIAALAVTGAFGQGERAAVTGTATDATGAIVVGAPVIIRNVTTNVVSKTTTNAAGI